MTWGQFKDSLSYMCLAGFMVTTWSLTQEVAGFNNIFDKICSLNSVNLMTTFGENSNNWLIGELCQRTTSFIKSISAYTLI